MCIYFHISFMLSTSGLDLSLVQYDRNSDIGSSTETRGIMDSPYCFCTSWCRGIYFYGYNYSVSCCHFVYTSSITGKILFSPPMPSYVPSMLVGLIENVDIITRNFGSLCSMALTYTVLVYHIFLFMMLYSSVGSSTDFVKEFIIQKLLLYQGYTLVCFYSQQYLLYFSA